MATCSVSSFIERIHNLLNYEEKKALSSLGLQPIHLRVLRYLNVCNKYSNTPLALATYLGNTKGTTSQTVVLLEQKGYIKKVPSDRDKRSVKLVITSKGKDLIANINNKVSSLEVLSPEEEKHFCELLKGILMKMQKYNGFKTFGVCRTCRFFSKRGGKFVCGLTGELLDSEEANKICQEHEYV